MNTKTKKLEAVLDITRAYAEDWIYEDDFHLAAEIARNPDFDELTAKDIITYLGDLGAKGDYVSGIWANVFSYDQSLETNLEADRLERVAA